MFKIGEKFNIDVFKINESQYIASFVVGGSMKKLFYQLIMSMIIFSQYFFFSIDIALWKSVGLPRIAYIVIH